MHLKLLVAGENVDQQLFKFLEGEVEPQEQFFDEDDIMDASQQFGIPPENLTELAAKMQPLTDFKYFIKDGKIGWFTTQNFNASIKFYEIGGVWENSLLLLEPQPGRKLFGIIPLGPKTQTSSARKHEIDIASLLHNPPMAVLVDGNWIESPVSLEGPIPKIWLSQLEQIIASIDQDTMLTIVDVRK
ncbi:MAG: hypothetical protein JWN25_93 [Verrucomicrobiales bacterium]|nr:hypothetical protein [Verrucomicrobiales bacterium]MDB6131120.1 hypothetical protein [Verrucomicrobiales bacterium]